MAHGGLRERESTCIQALLIHIWAFPHGLGRLAGPRDWKCEKLWRRHEAPSAADRGSPVKVGGGRSWLWLATHAGDSATATTLIPPSLHSNNLPSCHPWHLNLPPVEWAWRGDVGRSRPTWQVARASHPWACTLSHNHRSPAALLGVANPLSTSSKSIQYLIFQRKDIHFLINLMIFL